MSSTETTFSNKQPVLWASVIRIIATLLIYIFHFASLSQILLKIPVDKIGISLFLFISGFFSASQLNPLKWIIRRTLSIYIPYWLVIIVVLIVNHIIKYKPSNLLKDFIIVIGGSMFINDPVYVISWFISLIMLLYLFILGLRTISNTLFIICYTSIAFYFFNFYLKTYFLYFPSFLIGYMIRVYSKNIINFLSILSSFKIRFRFYNIYNKINTYLFICQNYCYSFFLIHAGVLWLLIKYYNLKGISIFVLGLCFTIILSYIHYNISKKIIDYIWTNVSRANI